jgi:hypothetical protein
MTNCLDPLGQLALIDFIFTGESIDVLKRAGASTATRFRIEGISFWISAVLMLGT